MIGLNVAAVMVAAGIASSAAPSVQKWRALLEPVGSATVRGGATAEAKGDGTTHFIISIRNGPPNTSLTWQMSTGTCSSPGAPEGSGYPTLQVGAGGVAQAAVTLSVPSPSNGNHVIVVQTGGSTVACGEFRSVE